MNIVIIPLFHRMSDDQYQLQYELQHGDYRRLQPLESDYAYRGMTLLGLEFEWMHGLGDGKDVSLQGVAQPAWFARRIRRILAEQGIGGKS